MSYLFEFLLGKSRVKQFYPVLRVFVGFSDDPCSATWWYVKMYQSQFLCFVQGFEMRNPSSQPWWPPAYYYRMAGITNLLSGQLSSTSAWFCLFCSFSHSAKHATCFILAIIMYVRLSYFQVTSKMSDVLWTYTLEVVKYFCTLKYFWIEVLYLISINPVTIDVTTIK